MRIKPGQRITIWFINVIIRFRVLWINKKGAIQLYSPEDNYSWGYENYREVKRVMIERALIPISNPSIKRKTV